MENKLIENKRVPTITMPKNAELYSVIGTVKIEDLGVHALTLEITSNFTGKIPKFRSVMLIPTNK